MKRLLGLLTGGTIVVDAEGAIQTEYRRHLSPAGQPGVGDRFFREVINSTPGRVERVMLPQGVDGDYVDFPTDAALAKFDPSDRKFAALSRREGIPVLTATDTDWLNDRAALESNRVQIQFVCGCDADGWFAR